MLNGVIIIVQRSVETRITVSVKDGTDKHNKTIVNKGVDLYGPMEDPKFLIKILETGIAKLKSETAQTELGTSEKTEVKTGSKEAKDAAKKVNEAKK